MRRGNCKIRGQRHGVQEKRMLRCYAATGAMGDDNEGSDHCQPFAWDVYYMIGQALIRQNCFREERCRVKL